MSTASTSACTGRSPAPSVSTIRRRVESARTSNTTDSTRDIYTHVYIHFSASLEHPSRSREAGVDAAVPLDRMNLGRQRAGLNARAILGASGVPGGRAIY